MTIWAKDLEVIFAIATTIGAWVDVIDVEKRGDCAFDFAVGTGPTEVAERGFIEVVEQEDSVDGSCCEILSLVGEAKSSDEVNGDVEVGVGLAGILGVSIGDVLAVSFEEMGGATADDSAAQVAAIT